MKSMYAFGAFISDHFMMGIIVIAVVYVLGKAFINWREETLTQKVDAALGAAKIIIYSLVDEAEKQFSSYKGAGSIKQSQVIDEVFKAFPILANFANRDEIIDILNSFIDDALEELKSVKLK